MQPHQGRLYVGSSGWYNNSLFPASELIRVNPNDTWDVVVGNCRIVGITGKCPISGMSDGYGNIFNAHFWRQQSHGPTPSTAALYVGTNDISYLYNLGLNLFASENGFDMYSSLDGRYWFQETRTGFGRPNNFGARTFASASTGAGPAASSWGAPTMRPRRRSSVVRLLRVPRRATARLGRTSRRSRGRASST